MAGLPRFVGPLVVLLLLASPGQPSPYSDNLQDACNKTLFPKVCIQSLTTNPETRTADARRLAELSVYVAKEVGTTVAAFAHHELSGVKDDVLFKCLDGCSDDIEETVAHLSALTREPTDAKFLEVKSWLSATLGGSSTCEESCKDAPISDVKNAAVTKSLEFEKLLRVTLDLITEASGSMSGDVAVPPTAWDASAPGSYGASAPDSYSASAPQSSSDSASAPGSSGSSAPESSGSASAPGSSGSSAPESSDSASAPGSSGSSAPRSEAPSTDTPAPSDAPTSDAPSADAPSSEAPSTDAPAPSKAKTSDAPSADAPAPSYGGASGPATDAPSSSPSDADAPSSGSAGAPSYGSAGAPSPSGADAPSASGADAPEADSPA